VLAHLEGNWGDPIRGSRTLLPSNIDAYMPGEPAEFALSELYLTQALSEQVTVVVGKADWASFADTSFFANNERTQFMHAALVNNGILGAFAPYTSLGAFALYSPVKELSIGGAVLQNAGNATNAGFDELDADKLTFSGAVAWSPILAGDLPGSYQLMAFYSTKDESDFAIDPRYLIGSIIGVVPKAEKDDNYALALTATQYVWASGETSTRGEPLGIGPFFRFGIAPDDRNIIDQFYSVGIGGKGGLFGRVDDQWGVGWAGSHISGEFRRLAGAIVENAGIELDDFEHVVEGYYNVAVTPAAALTVNLQYIHPIGSQRDDMLVLGARLQLDF